MALKNIIFIFSFALIPLSIKCQPLAFHGSFQYGIPVFDNYFRGAYESKIGYGLRLRFVRNCTFRYGFSYTSIPFRKTLLTPVDVALATMRQVSTSFAYDISKTDSRFMPALELGYAFADYDAGEFFGKGFIINGGLQVYFPFGPKYGLELGAMLNTTFNKFGQHLNPSGHKTMQYWMLSIGLTFDTHKCEG